MRKKHGQSKVSHVDITFQKSDRVQPTPYTPLFCGVPAELALISNPHPQAPKKNTLNVQLYEFTQLHNQRNYVPVPEILKYCLPKNVDHLG